MTLTPLNADAVRAAAEAAITDRISKIDAIAAAQQKVADAEAKDAEARAGADAAIKQANAAKRASAKTVQQCKDAVTAALRSALAGGWTAAQLREIGLTVPTSVIASPRPAAAGSGKKKRAVRPRIGIATDAVSPDDKVGAGDSSDASTPPVSGIDASPAAPEFAHAGQGGQ